MSIRGCHVVDRHQSGVSIRPERLDDASAIHAVHAAAFATDAEARLVDAIRANGRAAVSLVAEAGDRVVGHILFSEVTVGAVPDGPRGVGLAPLAVAPDLQRRGIGAALARSGIEACRAAGFGFVVVLGDPEYYARFGFGKASSRGLGNEYGVDVEFMVLELRDGGLARVSGVVAYCPEFALV
jgi:putative acetyltransferase